MQVKYNNQITARELPKSPGTVTITHGNTTEGKEIYNVITQFWFDAYGKPNPHGEEENWAANPHFEKLTEEIAMRTMDGYKINYDFDPATETEGNLEESVSAEIEWQDESAYMHSRDDFADSYRGGHACHDEVAAVIICTVEKFGEFHYLLEPDPSKLATDPVHDPITIRNDYFAIRKAADYLSATDKAEG